ncbi:MAG TPA: pseudouridine synthase [Fimbriimonadaceae bacterium]
MHKRIAASGLCSRRAAEELISQGRVQVNGEYVREMGVKVSPDDEVRVDGNPVGVTKTFTLIMNKPVGYVTTLFDPQGRQTVKKLLPKLDAMLKPVGRLDMDSEGLLLFTNDGQLAQRLTHPRFGIEKEYECVVGGIPEEAELEKLRKGIWITEGGKTAPAKVEVTNPGRRASTTMVRITIHEGRKRQVRLMFEAIGHEVLTLKRVRIGPLVLKNLPPSACRMLGKKEVDKLKSMVGLLP